MTLSNRNSSEKVLMRRSMMRKVYWTMSIERYLAKESFITEVAHTTTKYYRRLRKSGRYLPSLLCSMCVFTMVTWPAYLAWLPASL